MTEPVAGSVSNSKKVDEEDGSERSENINYDVLQDLCSNNAAYFATDSSENGQRLYISFLAIKETLNVLRPKINRISDRVAAFDFDEKIPGNGYRSFLSVVDSAILYAIQLNKKICLKRDGTFFRKVTFSKDLESCSHLLASLNTCLEHVETLLLSSPDGNLFPQGHDPIEFIAQYDDINQYCFYGRNLCFQYCDSLKNVIQLITISMAIFSEMYYNQGNFLSKATSSVIATSKYVNDPDQRARRIVNILQNAGVDFCKAFWFLSEHEILTNVPYVSSPSVAVSKVINLPAEPLILTIDNKDITIPLPESHIGKKHVQVRLISYDVHEGMIGEASNKPKTKPPARGLLFHCHGGGFVSQSSLSHESYLREWAKQLKIPILSVDYSLAPEAPFPRALEEVTYAYCWALKNYQLLGTTGERIVAAGDSAGGNLILATTLKCVHLGVPLPHGIFAAYVPTLVDLTPSPARILSMIDPLLPFGFMMRCLKAYTCSSGSPSDHILSDQHNSDTESFEEISESDLMELQAHKSPVSEMSDTLTYGSLNSGGIEEEMDRNDDLDDGQQFVSDFLEKYVLDSDTDTDGTKIAILTQQERESATSSATTLDNSLQNRVSNFMTSLRWRLGNWVSSKKQIGAEFMCPKFPSAAERHLDKTSNFLDELKFDIPKDPYLSPFLADDSDLSRFPSVKVLSVNLDPCLDDCIMFAKRLKSLDKDVTLDVLNDLPHGFLNFTMVSREAYEGCKVCIERISQLLDLDGLPQPQQ